MIIMNTLSYYCRPPSRMHRQVMLTVANHLKWYAVVQRVLDCWQILVRLGFKTCWLMETWHQKAWKWVHTCSCRSHLQSYAEHMALDRGKDRLTWQFAVFWISDVQYSRVVFLPFICGLTLGFFILSAVSKKCPACQWSMLCILCIIVKLADISLLKCLSNNLAKPCIPVYDPKCGFSKRNYRKLLEKQRGVFWRVGPVNVCHKQI